ncbi:hypothetical protein K474DRAFT_1561859, partial [Panus rudis PR-1116 ss-1]
RKALQDIESYCTLQFSRQHRTSILFLCVFGRYVRFIRIDRSGAVVSEATNYIENPRILAQFFWKYSHLSSVERGFDPTVVPASVEECQLLTRAVRQYMRAVDEQTARFHPSMECTLANDYPIYKATVPNCDTGEDHHYLIQKPCSESKYVLGRATRGYIALALNDTARHKTISGVEPPAHPNRLVFLKDYWRKYPTDMQKEAEVYKDLEDLHVPHLPQLFGGGDVMTSDAYLQSTQSPNPLDRYAHHRLVQQLGFPLKSAKDAKELVQVIRDALEGLISAWVRGRRLHRDISYNNILLNPDACGGPVRGLLNDWDISLDVPAARAKIPK